MNRVVMENHELPYDVNEEIKLLRTNLQFSGTDKRVIMITSCTSNEGKTTQCIRLARSFAELGKRVLLIDADLRKSYLKDKLIEGSVSFGLSHFLSGQCSFDDAVCKTETEGMYVIFAGVLPPNPSELLSTDTFRRLIAVAREHFDYIVIDPPPLGMVVDAAVIAPNCDGTVLAIKSGEIKYRYAQDVADMLKKAQAPLLGVVLTQVGHKQNGRYYGRYYGKYYKGYRKYDRYYKYEKNKK